MEEWEGYELTCDFIQYIVYGFFHSKPSLSVIMSSSESRPYKTQLPAINFWS